MKSVISIQGRYRRYIKTRLNLIRGTGLFMSAVGIGIIALQYFLFLNSIWNAVSILYICGFLFTNMAQYQDLRKSSSFAVACRFFAALFYVATLALLVLILLDRFLVIQL